MKIHVGTVHLVTSSQKCCHEEGLGLLVAISETAAFGTWFEYLNAKCVFLYTQLDMFKRARVVRLGYFVH